MSFFFPCKRFGAHHIKWESPNQKQNKNTNAHNKTSRLTKTKFCWFCSVWLFVGCVGRKCSVIYSLVIYTLPCAFFVQAKNPWHIHIHVHVVNQSQCVCGRTAATTSETIKFNRIVAHTGACIAAGTCVEQCSPSTLCWWWSKTVAEKEWKLFAQMMRRHFASSRFYCFQQSVHTKVINVITINSTQRKRKPERASENDERNAIHSFNSVFFSWNKFGCDRGFVTPSRSSASSSDKFHSMATWHSFVFVWLLSLQIMYSVFCSWYARIML